jgi:type IV pilus modification protein PilV
VTIKHRRLGSEQGFTLIEVLIALVILAVGILGLEALGIYAVRAVAQADRNSRSAAVATLYLEDALQQIRTDRVPRSCTNKVLRNGDVVSRSVIVGTSFSEASRVSVTVTPASRGRVELPYTIAGYGYTPKILTVPGNACP